MNIDKQRNLLHVLTSEIVKVCGRRPGRSCPTHRQPASANRQWTKSREVGNYGAAVSTQPELAGTDLE